MEPPEDSLPEGLSWPRFTSLYAKARHGASRQEVSSAWERYKQQSTERRRSPKKSPKRSGKEDTSKPASPERASPVRTLTSTQAASLGNLPPEILAGIAAKSRGSAAVLAQLNRRTHGIASQVVKTYCKDDISVPEIRQHILRTLGTLRARLYKKSMRLFVYTRIDKTTAIFRSYNVWRVAATSELRVSEDTTRASSGPGGVESHGSSRLITADSNAAVAEAILAAVVKDTGTLLLTLDEVADVLRARRGCSERQGDGDSLAYMDVRVRSVLAALHNPVLDEQFLSRRRIADAEVWEVARAILRGRDQKLGCRTLMTLIMLGSSIAGQNAAPYVFELSLDAQTYEVVRALYNMTPVLRMVTTFASDEE
jgi:hypothetical protein